MSVWKPITSVSGGIYVYEMRVLRSVASAVCAACRVPATVLRATYSATPSLGTYANLIDGNYAPMPATPLVLPASTGLKTGGCEPRCAALSLCEH